MSSVKVLTAPRNAPSRRRGLALVYLAVTITVLVGFCSLAVDFGRVQAAKTELRSAADAAALSGAAGLSNGNAATYAIATAGQNYVDGTPLALQNADVVTGTWSNGSFTAGGASPNAIQVTAHRTSARGTAVPLMFAQVIGRSSCDVNATSVAVATSNPAGGIVGYNGIGFKNNFFAASYNSSVLTNPTQNNANSNGSLGSNAAISGKNNNKLKGSALLGPNGSATGITVSPGSSTPGTATLVPPTMPSWPPGTNPNNIAQAYTVSSATTLPAGTYWFTSLSINADLTFAGPSTVYVNGNVDLNAGLTASNSIPANLRIYQLGSGTFGDSGSNGMDVTADIWAPSVTFSAKNNFVFRGRAFFGSISAVKNNAEMYYDEAFGPASGGASVGLDQ